MAPKSEDSDSYSVNSISESHNHRNFWVAIVALFLLAIGLSFGIYTWQNKKVDDLNKQLTSLRSDTETSTSANNGETGANDSILDPTDLLEPYVLPAGWKDKECKQGVIAIVPPETDDPGCEADQPNITVAIYIADNHNYIDPESCEYTKTKIERDYAGFESYDCKDIEIDGKKGIRSTGKGNEESFIGDYTSVTYTFPSDGQLLTIEYVRITEQNDPDYTQDFDNFVNSLKFQY